MKKVLIATALLFTAMPFTFDGVTPTVSKADARIGRPLTPLSVAGVHRRVVRRNFGVGANLGYRGFHPVARAAAVGAVGASATGWGGGWGAPGWGGGWAAPGWGISIASPGWGGGWGGWGWNRPIFAAAPGWGSGWGAPGWGGGWGWNRPVYSCSGPFCGGAWGGWNRGWGW